jgi:hypothetical protein
MARPKAGSNLSISQLQDILDSRLADLQQLKKQHAKLSDELAEVERKIAAIDGNGHVGRIGSVSLGGRVKNKMSLVETLEQVLSGASEPMKVGDIVDAVLKAGYRTKSDNFRSIVNQTLIKERQLFTSAGRGLYQAKSKK